MIIDGRYEVVRTIASGGMATVHLVRHVHLDSQHALKILHIPSPDIRRRLLQEGKVQASVRHPNIVAVTDTLLLDGSPGLVMEFVEGPSLETWLETHRPTLQQIDSWFAGILAGVGYAHQHGLVHRDLKPANVLLSPIGSDYLPKVADFGIVKVLAGDNTDASALSSKTRTGIAMGTPAYMSPEQMESASKVGPPSDVFALGCILYDMVCGKRAFDGPHLVAIATKAREGMYDDPEDVAPGLPQRIYNAIRGALVPDPEIRIQDCAALATVLGYSTHMVSSVPTPRPFVAPSPTLEPRHDTGPTPVPATLQTWAAPDPAPPAVAAPPTPTYPPPEPLLGRSRVGVALLGGGIGVLIAGIAALLAVVVVLVVVVVVVLNQGPAASPVAAKEPGPTAQTTTPDPAPTVLDPTSPVAADPAPAPAAKGTDRPSPAVAAHVDPPAVDAPAAASAPTTAVPPAAIVATRPTVPRLPRSGSLGAFTVTVNGSRTAPEVQHAVFKHAAPAGSTLLLVDVTVHNGGTRGRAPIDPFSVTRGGKSVRAVAPCELALSRPYGQVTDVPAGKEVRGEACFEVPTGSRAGTLSFQPDAGGPTLKLAL